MTYLEVLERVKKINAELVKHDYTPEMIENFWNEVLKPFEKQLNIE